MDSAQEAAKGTDIFATATDSIMPTMKAEWLEPGMHFTDVSGSKETDPATYDRADVILQLGQGTVAPGSPDFDYRRASASIYVGAEEELDVIPKGNYQEKEYPPPHRPLGGEDGGPHQRRPDHLLQELGHPGASVRGGRRCGVQAGAGAWRGPGAADGVVHPEHPGLAAGGRRARSLQARFLVYERMGDARIAHPGVWTLGSALSRTTKVRGPAGLRR